MTHSVQERSSSRSTAGIEAALWLAAILAMLPYPLSNIAGAYYVTSAPQAKSEVTSATHASKPIDIDVGVTAPDTSLWSEGRKRAFARMMPPGVPIRAEALLVLPGQSQGIAVFNGATEMHMTFGAGRLLDSSPLDGDGNIALSAHRDGAFRALKDLAVGDRLRLVTRGSERLFEVATLSIVKPDAVHVLEPTASPTLTLITCYPFYYVGSAPDRYVVQARLLQPDNTRPATPVELPTNPLRWWSNQPVEQSTGARQ